MTDTLKDMVHYAFVPADHFGPERVEVYEGDPVHKDFVGEVPDEAMIARVSERVYPGPARDVAKHAIRLYIGTDEHVKTLESEALSYLRREKNRPVKEINTDELDAMRVLEDDPAYDQLLGPLSIPELEALERLHSVLDQSETQDNRGEE